MKTLYLIPARGGSKGIPHKNIRPLCGLPLIGYSINVAREFADDRDICLSTDDPEIAETARKMGLDVPFMRPDSLATDKSGSYEVMLHALDFYHNRGVDYDRLVLLQPTSPMRTADDVRRALELYTPDIDMVVTVKRGGKQPLLQLLRGRRRRFSANLERRRDFHPAPGCPESVGIQRRGLRHQHHKPQTDASRQVQTPQNVSDGCRPINRPRHSARLAHRRTSDERTQYSSVFVILSTHFSIYALQYN